MCSQIFLCDLIIAVVDSLNYFSWWICLLLRGSLLLVLTQCSNSVTSKIYYGKMYFPFKINWLRWRKAAKILNKCAGKKMLLREQVNIWLKRNESAESNGSYFMMLAHDIRGGCWWDDSRGWIFLPISHYILLLCSKWQMRDSLTEWHLMWKCVWRKGVSLNSSMPKKKGAHWSSLMPAERLWRPNSGCEHSEAVWWWQQHERHSTLRTAMYSCHTTKWRVSQPAHLRITTRKLCMELNISFSASETMVAVLEYNKVCARRVSWISQRNRKNTVCKFVRTYWTNMNLKVKVSYITVISPLKARIKMAVCGVAAWVPHWRQSSRRSSQWVKWWALPFGIGKEQSSGFPGTQTNHQLWLLYREAD